VIEPVPWVNPGALAVRPAVSLPTIDSATSVPKLGLNDTVPFAGMLPVNVKVNELPDAGDTVHDAECDATDENELIVPKAPLPLKSTTTVTPVAAVVVDRFFTVMFAVHGLMSRPRLTAQLPVPHTDRT